MFGSVEKQLISAVLGAICLFYIATLALPELGWQTLRQPGQPPISPIARLNRAKQIEDLFLSKTALNIKPVRNMSNPFFPNPEQPAPPAPPPSTVDVQVLYQGYFQTSNGDRKAYVQVGDKTIVGGVNTKVTGTFTISAISFASLTIKDSLGKVVELPFRTAKAVTIPAP